MAAGTTLASVSLTNILAALDAFTGSTLGAKLRLVFRVALAFKAFGDLTFGLVLVYPICNKLVVVAVFSL